MSSISLTPAQHAILAHAVEWVPANIHGGARQKVLDGLAKRGLIRQVGKRWRVAAEGYDALGMSRPGVRKKRIDKFETKLDQIIANAEGAQPAPSDAELEAAVASAEATWAKPPTRAHSKQAEVVRMLQRSEGATVRQICEATGWQAHTVRGAFAGAFEKKLGLTITSDKEQGGERCGIDLAHGTYHTVLALEPKTVFFESKAGPYRPLEMAELAPWAPVEGAREAQGYLAALRDLFD